MGSWNSGRWHNHVKKVQVEACEILDVCELLRGSNLLAEGQPSGKEWLFPGIESRDGVLLDLTTGSPMIRLFHTSTLGSGRKKIEERIFLTTTQPFYGGIRFWGICAGINGNSCGRRVRKLYMPPNSDFWACRHKSCHNLTDRKAQEHDSRIDALVKNPELLPDLPELIREENFAEFSLVLKARKRLRELNG